MTEEDITQQLKSSIQIEVIKCLKMKGSSEKSNSFLITMDNKINTKDLYKIKELDHVKITWQKFNKKSNITQCHRCQKFGHGSTNCNRAPRCVKCIWQHLTKDCTITKDGTSTVQCTNCHGQHTANYSQCPEFLRYVETLNKNNNVAPIKPISNQSAIPIHSQKIVESGTQSHNQTRLYSNVLKDQTKNDYTDFQTLLNEIHELNKICNISALISLVREIRQKMTDCKTPLEKIMLIEELSRKHGI